MYYKVGIVQQVDECYNNVLLFFFTILTDQNIRIVIEIRTIVQFRRLKQSRDRE